jgi:glycerate 2-kinase
MAPCLRCHLIGDQILPDFDQRVVQAALRGVAVDRVAGQAAAIGLVIAYDKIKLACQHIQPALAQAHIRVIKNADMPGPRPALHLRRERVQREDRRRMTGRDRMIDGSGDCRIIGRVIAGHTLGNTSCTDAVIGRNDRAIGELPHQSRIFRATIGIDQQSREAGQDRWRVEAGRHGAGHAGRTDIIGDMALHFGSWQAECAHFNRNSVAGMITKQEHTTRGIACDDFNIAKIMPGLVRHTDCPLDCLFCGARTFVLAELFRFCQNKSYYLIQTMLNRIKRLRQVCCILKMVRAIRYRNMTAMPLQNAVLSDSAAQRAVLVAIFDVAVATAHPSSCLVLHLPAPPAKGRLILLSAGKAAGSMVQVAERHYLDTIGIDQARFMGAGVARHGYGAATRLIKVSEAGHPVPDQGSIMAADKALALASQATPDDLVLVLLSGGGSANWVAPARGITLGDKQMINRQLLRSGAGIGEINTVRKRLSRIKGGRLARAAEGATLLTLAISDVPGDDPGVIASGPTAPDTTTNIEAMAVAKRYGLELSMPVRMLLNDPHNETPKPGDKAFARAEYRIIATPAQSIAAACTAARAAGYEPVSLGADVEGEARDVAAAQAKMALELKAQGRKYALISGGELTVTIQGKGRGGPNQEYALALAIALDGATGIAALAGDTDGTDGGAGEATDPAGAIVTATTLSRARALKIDPAAYLADNNSTGFFEKLGDLLTPGPTLTNVNDCRVILIDP